jgi:transcriptional antiterminator RfaH
LDDRLLRETLYDCCAVGETMTGWYVIRTKARQESLARQNLFQQGYEAYLPLFLETRQRRRNPIDIVVPLFPGYLFVYLDTASQSTGPIRSTLGVIGMLRFGDRMPRVPEPMIADLKRNTDPETGLVRPPQVCFEAGDKVRVATGPCAGLEGIYQAPAGADRARILIEFLGCQRTATLSNADIRPTGRCSTA